MKISFAKKIAVAIGFFYSVVSIAQPGTTIDLENEKPEKYKEKMLVSEKTPDGKKIGAVKKFTNNLVTHFNYFYNANIKVEEILEAAKQSFTDDYTKLLPFYNFSLNTTATDKNIDSIIYKCNAGILLHDLRSDWVDDMYMLLGRAYFLRKNYDSAHHVFQYLNYVYAPKQDGYDVPIGSNESNEEGIFTIATNEKKRKLLQKIFKSPTKRNDALIWIVKNYLAQNKAGEASGLLQMLENDPYFPKRLQTDLYEVTSYNYYLQKQYDSSAKYLIKCLGNAKDKAERSRWEFLAAQMLQLSNNAELANKMYASAIKHTTNPLVELNAYLNMIIGLQDSTQKNKKSNATITNSATLEKLAKKERFEPYRDIIYYNIGNIYWQENDLNSAANYFNKSIVTSVDNVKQKNISFLALADVEYLLKHYKNSYANYDSIKLESIDKASATRVSERKPALKKISDNLDAIYLQDSLQALAKLSPQELNNALKKVYKKYLKEKGLREDEGSNSFDFGSDNATTSNNTNSFNITTKPGEFYFDNESLKANGIKEFKSKWGNRPNVDNWNRASAVSGKFDDDKSNKSPTANNQKKAGNSKALSNSKSTNLKGGVSKNGNKVAPSQVDLSQENPDAAEQEDIRNTRSNEIEDANASEKEITPESLFESVPLSKEKITLSNDIIIEALYENGDIFSNTLEDYPSAIETYEELLRRFPKSKHTDQVIFNLSYCYNKAKQTPKFEKLGIDVANIDLAKNKSNSSKDEATKKYESIYNMFIEGQYEEAKKEKVIADSLYSKIYWNPQLSFIESVYYIKQRKDSIAIDRLNLIVGGNADKALQEKAKLMIDILKRRKEIEAYLASLDSNGKYDSSLAAKSQAEKDSIAAAIAAAKAKESIFEEYTKDMSLVGKPFIFNPNEPHYAVMLLEKVDDVFLLETKKSFDKYNREFYGGNPPIVKLAKLNKEYTLVLLGPLSNSTEGIGYIDNTKPRTNKFLPWLPPSKYTYTMIGVSNLDILRVNDNLSEYKKFLKQHFPSKF